MRFEKFIPTDQLKPYIKYFVVSENELENEYKVFPSSGLVIGFQYKGQLVTIKENTENKLSSAGITGITDGYKIFKNSADIGTILVYFTETGFTHFASHPANELFNLSLSLDDVFDRNSVTEVEEKLTIATTDKHRIKIVEQFLVSQQDFFLCSQFLFVLQQVFSIKFPLLGTKELVTLKSAIEKRHMIARYFTLVILV